jgi:hypothetical protein
LFTATALTLFILPILYPLFEEAADTAAARTVGEAIRPKSHGH